MRARLCTWVVTLGRFEVQVGGSSPDLPLSAGVEVTSSQAARNTLTRRSMVQDVLGRPGGEAVCAEMLQALGLAAATKPGALATIG